MKFSFWLGAFALFSFVAGVAAPAASNSVRWKLVVGAGASLPVSSNPLQEGLAPGVSGTWGVAARIAAVELVGRMAYTRFGRDDNGVMVLSGLVGRPVNVLEMTGGEMTTSDLVVDARYFPAQGESETTAHPFLLAAAGVSSYRYEGVEILYQYAGHTWPDSVAAQDGTNASLGVGAGIGFATGHRWSVVVEGRYEQVLRPGDDLRSAQLRVELNVAP